MPANLPPQFFEVQKKLNEASSIEEKIQIYEELLRIVPKHKGTERIQEDLKRKIAKLRKTEIKKPKHTQLFFIKKEGAGQIVILGPPNSGKSSLLNVLTQANVKVAPYPFTTQIPQPGMIPYENLLFQLIDMPPITQDFILGWQKEIMKNADLILVLLDLSSENFFEDLNFFQNKISELNLSHKKILWVGNKIDLEEGKENFEKIKDKFQIFPISTLKKIGLEDLKKKIFEKMEIVRVYPKSKNRPPNFDQPFVIKKGTKLIDLAKEIHEDLFKNFKFAKLFKKNSKKPKIVGKDYILEDEDIVEIRS
jgi:uncharacterized protein